MLKRKISPNDHDGNAMCTWTFAMDDVLIDEHFHQQTMGNRVGGIFTTYALENIVNELKGKFPNKPIDKKNTQNHKKI